MEILKAIEPLNNAVSCGTSPTRFRSARRGISDIDTLSNAILPAQGSQNRKINLANDDLPDPLGPTMATRLPAGTEKVTSERTAGPRQYEKHTESNVSSPEKVDG
jgi:hypothetical protein